MRLNKQQYRLAKMQVIKFEEQLYSLRMMLKLQKAMIGSVESQLSELRETVLDYESKWRAVDGAQSDALKHRADTIERMAQRSCADLILTGDDDSYDDRCAQVMLLWSEVVICVRDEGDINGAIRRIQDILRIGIGAFFAEEAIEFLQNGCLNRQESSVTTAQNKEEDQS